MQFMNNSVPLSATFSEFLDVILGHLTEKEMESISNVSPVIKHEDDLELYFYFKNIDGVFPFRMNKDTWRNDTDKLHVQVRELSLICRIAVNDASYTDIGDGFEFFEPSDTTKEFLNYRRNSAYLKPIVNRARKDINPIGHDYDFTTW